MFRFGYALFASAILSLALCSPMARADETLTYHADGTSTMVTDYGPGDQFNHTTEFDAQGNVTSITWQGPPTTIVQYDALGRVDSTTVVEDKIKTVRINTYFPGGIIRYWVRVVRIDEEGRERLVSSDGFWGGLNKPLRNAGNCLPQPPVIAPGKTNSNGKDDKPHPGAHQSEMKSNPVGGGKKLQSVPASPRLVPARSASAPKTVSHGLPMANVKSTNPHSR